jgi:uncharacterized protein (DUF1697 family)
MATFVALLRGINVGKAKRLPMAQLREVLADLGYDHVVTLLNSGNAVFQASGSASAQHAKNIAAAILERFKFEVPVIVKSANELAAIVVENPLTAIPSEHSRFLVGFVQDTRTLSGLKGIESLVKLPEQFAVGRSAAYLYCARGILESKAGEALLGKAASKTTSRNWATVLKLAALAK